MVNKWTIYRSLGSMEKKKSNKVWTHPSVAKRGCHYSSTLEGITEKMSCTNPERVAIPTEDVCMIEAVWS